VGEKGERGRGDWSNRASGSKGYPGFKGNSGDVEKTGEKGDYKSGLYGYRYNPLADVSKFN